ncbi:hypothetical protein [Trinickia dinghuensis]|nr:hypothetical protein [Trinickia dinghuensis]
MTESRNAGWQWHSEQGSDCTENRDACGIYQCEAYTFCVVMDASPRGKRGPQFNAAWLNRVLERMEPELPSDATMLSVFRDAQEHLREQKFVAEKASYTAILLPRDEPQIRAFNCGDCSLGHRSPQGEITWLTETDTLANTFEAFGIVPDASKRHIVARTLNPKRFQLPSVSTIQGASAGSWVLATDGYRYTDIDDDGRSIDDRSYLLLGTEVESQSDLRHTNLFVRST